MQPIYVSVQLAAASATAISASQTPVGAGNLLINGSAASGGVATLDTPRQVLFTFAADETGHTFVVYGTGNNGIATQETVLGTTAGTVATTQNFKTVTRISISAAATGAITVGTNGIGSSDWKIVNWDISPINIGIVVIVTGTVNYTVQYTMEDPGGTYPNPNAVTAGYYDANTQQLVQLPTPLNLTALASKAATTDGAIVTPIAALRLQVNSGTGTAQMVYVQAGIQGG